MSPEEAGGQSRQNHSVRPDGQTYPAFPAVHSAATGQYSQHAEIHVIVAVLDMKTF